MFRIKRLFTLILGTFLPVLLATFSVCLFIILMQFLWKHVNDMVGKGVDMIVLGQLFFYAGVTFTPMALPLSILLASLMTFGNLGEHMELLAMKASGISLVRIMKPLVYFSLVLVVVSFVFQNNILPHAQTKTYTILLSLRQKSPELDIPEGVFYKEITGYNVYVRHKDKKTGMLQDMMIYDYSQGFENAVVTAADSGKLKVSNDKKYLILTLYNGESFENLEKMQSRSVDERVRYRRETFELRDVLINYDMNFNLADESIMGNRDSGKNVSELTQFIDSVQHKQDSINTKILPQFVRKAYKNGFSEGRTFSFEPEYDPRDTLFRKGFQHYYDLLNTDSKITHLQLAKSKAEQVKMENNIEMFWQNEYRNSILSHKIQLHRKFSVAISCLLFFFIGAPLGTIIRKGGLGMPAVLSVLFFLLYYTIDTFGTKMAKQEVWVVWQGVWLSTFVLAALGAFFTYKAVNDSTIMNPDAWKNFLQKLIGKREIRNYSKKDVIMETPDYTNDIRMMQQWNEESEKYLKEHSKPTFYFSFWKNGFGNSTLKPLVEKMELWIDDLRNSDENLIVGKLMDYPVIDIPNIKLIQKPFAKWFCIIVFPIGLVIYLWALLKQRQINHDIKVSRKVNDNIITELDKLIKDGYEL
ncbi:MAG: LptF/LptG family permease [Bacteroidales bacterium]|nr:LptF/LptG family permease [Bacteroidales bacterium]